VFEAGREAFVARAVAAGVERMVSINTRLSTFERLAAIAEAHPEVWCTVGVHPQQAGEEFEGCTVERIVGLSRHPRVVAIGESGLDYFYDKSPRDLQQESFRRHVRACLETGHAIVVHTRDAEADTMAILREEAGRGNEAGLRGVLHCFTGSRALAEEALAFGFHVSFSGILTFKKSEELRDVARIVPLDRLLVETDAPYLAPEPHRGKSNEPSYVVHTARRLAEVKGVSLEALAAATTANVERLFRGIGGTDGRAAA
jgi:TatD DNase family protein